MAFARHRSPPSAIEPPYSLPNDYHQKERRVWRPSPFTRRGGQRQVSRPFSTHLWDAYQGSTGGCVAKYHDPQDLVALQHLLAVPWSLEQRTMRERDSDLRQRRSSLSGRDLLRAQGGRFSIAGPQRFQGGLEQIEQKERKHRLKVGGKPGWR